MTVSKIKLAIVPKVHWINAYSTAYGSQHHYAHIFKCLNVYKLSNNFFDFKIIYPNQFFKKYDLFDAVIFIGANNEIHKFLNKDLNIKKYIWSFNQYDWINNPKNFNNTRIVFEQSNENLENFKIKNNLVHLPLGFQDDIIIASKINKSYDLVFNGTLDREARLNQKFLRKDLLKELLKMNIKIINYNGRGHKKIEKDLLKELKEFENFTVINNFGLPKHYCAGNFSLDLPFLNLGATKDLNWGMSVERIDNGIWLNHWDTFRSIGSRPNLITFDAPEIRILGISDKNVNFFQSDPSNIKKMAEEIYEIIKRGHLKKIDLTTWNNNTFQSRWNIILENIFKDINSENLLDFKENNFKKKKIQIGIPCGYNSEKYIALLIKSAEKTASNIFDIEFIISINNKRVNLSLIEAIKSKFKITIYKNTKNLVINRYDSYGHGKNLDFLLKKINSEYGILMDCDVCFLKKNWDKILYNLLDDETIIIGSEYIKQHYLNFPNAIFCFFKTNVLKFTNISFKPNVSFMSKLLIFRRAQVNKIVIDSHNKEMFAGNVNDEIYLDCGYELPTKLKKYKFKGIPMKFVKSSDRNAKFIKSAGEEYQLGSEPIITHLGRSMFRNMLSNKDAIKWSNDVVKWINSENVK